MQALSPPTPEPEPWGPGATVPCPALGPGKHLSKKEWVASVMTADTRLQPTRCGGMLGSARAWEPPPQEAGAPPPWPPSSQNWSGDGKTDCGSLPWAWGGGQVWAAVCRHGGDGVKSRVTGQNPGEHRGGLPSPAHPDPSPEASQRFEVSRRRKPLTPGCRGYQATHVTSGLTKRLGAPLLPFNCTAPETL